MTVSRRARGLAGLLLLGCALLLGLSGCALFHHRHREDIGCRQPAFNLQPENEPPLRSPTGLNSPDQSAEIKIPTLNTPETPRPKTAPCLDWPPNYVNEPPAPPGRRSAVPAPS